MHFAEKMGRPDAWQWEYVSLSVLMLTAINFAGFVLPWWFGWRALERHEE